MGHLEGRHRAIGTCRTVEIESDFTHDRQTPTPVIPVIGPAVAPSTLIADRGGDVSVRVERQFDAHLPRRVRRIGVFHGVRGRLSDRQQQIPAGGLIDSPAAEPHRHLGPQPRQLVGVGREPDDQGSEAGADAHADDHDVVLEPRSLCHLGDHEIAQVGGGSEAVLCHRFLESGKTGVERFPSTLHQAVGVQHHHRPRRHRHRCLGSLTGGHRAERRGTTVREPTRHTVGRHDEDWWMAGAGIGQPARLRVQHRGTGGGEVGGRRSGGAGVEIGQQPARATTARSQGAHGGSQPAHRNSRVQSVADHVAHGDTDTAIVELKALVPITADFQPVGGRVVARRQFDRSVAEESVGQQGLLQPERHRVLVFGEPGVGH